MAKLKKFLPKNKRADKIMESTIIFIVLNLIFALLLLFFVYKTSTGAVVYEQFYAKQIALMIDNAKPNTQISLDFKKGIEVAEENKITSKEGMVRIMDNKVFVKLSGKDGYSMDYFSNYNVSYFFMDENLIILIKNNEEEIQNDK